MPTRAHGVLHGGVADGAHHRDAAEAGDFRRDDAAVAYGEDDLPMRVPPEVILREEEEGIIGSADAAGIVNETQPISVAVESEADVRVLAEDGRLQVVQRFVLFVLHVLNQSP